MCTCEKYVEKNVEIKKPRLCTSDSFRFYKFYSWAELAAFCASPDASSAAAPGFSMGSPVLGSLQGTMHVKQGTKSKSTATPKERNNGMQISWLCKIRHHASIYQGLYLYILCIIYIYLILCLVYSCGYYKNDIHICVNMTLRIHQWQLSVAICPGELSSFGSFQETDARALPVAASQRRCMESWAPAWTPQRS